MNHNAVKNEILTGQWAMSPEGFFLLGNIIKSITSGEFVEHKKVEAIDALSFFNESSQQIRPRDISEIPEGSVAVVNLVGPIMRYGSYYALGAEEVVAQFDFIENHSNILGSVLNTNGPGGSVDSINPFKDFAKRKKKPIIGLMNASLSMHRWIPDVICDYQMAENNLTARMGSVGIVSAYTDAEKYYAKMGIIFEEVYPLESLHKSEIWRTMKKDKKKGKEMLRKQHLSPLAIAFQNDVKAAHPNLLLSEEGVITGRTFGADDAVRINMIDSIGSMQEAMDRVRMLAEVSSI